MLRDNVENNLKNNVLVKQLVFVDNFTDVNSTTIITHASDSGYAWVAQNGFSPTNHARINNNKLYPLSSLNVYRANFVMPSANCEVEGVLNVLTNTGILGVNARASNTENTYYTWRYQGGVGWQLQKFVLGTLTSLATFNQTLTAGQTVTAKIVCNGSTIEGYVDGVLRASVTDTDITEAGSLGLRMPLAVTTTTGAHVDSVLARLI